MNNTGTRFKLSALTLAILASSSSAFASQQAEEESVENSAVNESPVAQQNKKSDSDELEVITVSGFRGSLLKAMSQKRNSANVSDSIFAEDIGKSTDQNIADALSRVTGVSVQTEDGEGTRITVRGANPNQNQITLNGVQLTSSDFNQSVDLSTFSSDVLSSISVVKTPSADHDEGSLGASIQLNTVKPLNVTNNVRSVTLQGRYNDFNEEGDYKVSGSFSEKFFDEDFGVIVTAYDETISVRRDQFTQNGWRARDVFLAKDQNGNVVTDQRVIVPGSTQYSLHENARDRQGITMGLQWLATDSTDISLNLDWSRQEKIDTFHQLSIRNSVSEDRPNLQEGVPHIENFEGEPYVPTYSDPQQDWWTIDTISRTATKALDRFADGGFTRRNGGDSTTNKIVNLNIKQEITDDLRMELGVNYSKTELEQIPTYTVSLLNNGANKTSRLIADPYGTPHTGIQPAGFDCTTGRCELVFGDGISSIEDPNSPWDNRSVTAFNPFDTRAFNVNSQLRRAERFVGDEIKTAFVDFDYDLDLFGITKVEFGAKMSKREKFVDDQEYRFENAGKAVSVNQYDPDGNVIGVRIIQPGLGIGNISADNFLSGEEFPHDNFMQTLGFSNQGLSDGWPLLSVNKLLESAFDTENLQLTKDDSRTRNAAVEKQAAYVKVNYELLDGKLTGDLGVRWTRTDLETFGNSGVRYGSDVLGRNFDPFLMAQMRNPLLPACETATPNAPNPRNVDNRIDGLGWDTTTDPDNPTRIPVDPAGYPCFDENTLYNNRNAHWTFSQHSDPVRQRQYRWTDDPSVVEDRSLLVFGTQGDNTYDLFLPSLNVNYQMDEDLIGRFAISKTMSRPNFDSLQPGFSLNESIWASYGNPHGNINLRNPKLMPQESKNLDLSLEWYFNQTSLLSVALFHKDMSNFEEQEQTKVYLDDLRYLDVEAGYDLNNLIKTEEQIRAEWAENPQLTSGVGKNACYPFRGHIFHVRQDWWWDDSDYMNWCGEFSATTLRNGAGATITGLEMTYQQTFDFLPGDWSGLGTQINYTYQESKLDKDFSSFNENVELPQLPRPWTPQHSYNFALYWEKYGHQVRLAYRGNSDQLMNRFSGDDGSLWQEGKGSLDISATYKISPMINLSFQGINLTDAETRAYFTSRTFDLGDVDAEGNTVPFDEGSALGDSDASTSRTQTLSKTGRIFRLSLRVKF